MEEKTKLFLARRFKAYYQRARNRIKPPCELVQREWGFVLFDQQYPEKQVMRRHLAFASPDDFFGYLQENAPAHAYHSAALYQNPTAEMAKKGWLGADLIFDLDADHIVDAAELPRYSYEELLALVKQETLKLLDFLLNDFGFAEPELELAFSGSRGYHVHVPTAAVRALGSRERREIVDYVMATGLAIDRFLVPPGRVVRGEKAGREDLRLLPAGWGKRVHRGLLEFLHEIAALEDEQAINAIRQIGGMERKKALELIRIARDETVMKRIEEGKIPQFAPWISAELTRTITQLVRVRSADRVDEPVTADIKRLIRLPGSLHGKSSLLVRPLTVASLKEFEPLRDAVVFGDSPITIRAVRDSSIRLKGERYEVHGGEIVTVPEHVALYLIARGAAECT
jgi:DNA primase small subunit